MQLSKKPLSSIVFSILIGVVMIAYPFMIYLHIDNVSPRWFAIMLLVLLIVRCVFIGLPKQKVNWLLPIAISVFCLSIVVLESEPLLKLYPVIMNVGMGLAFIISLTGKQSLIEKLASVGKEKPPAEAKNYLRCLNLAWGALLMLNGIVSACIAYYASLSFWAFYNGFLSYLIIGIFALSEYVYRGFYKRKLSIIND